MNESFLSRDAVLHVCKYNQMFSASHSRPNLLGSNMGNYPWLADSWPTPNLTHNSKDSVNCCSGKLDADRYYNGTNLAKLKHCPSKFSARR